MFTGIGRTVLWLALAAAHRSAPGCAGCRVVPVDRPGATCSPGCWAVRHR